MSDNSTNNKRIAKNTFFLTIRMIFVTLVYIYTSRVILNALGVVDYGIYNVIGGFVSMFGFLNLSLANGIQRFYNYELGAKGTGAITPVYNAALIIQGVLALVILLLLESVGLWYLYSKMVIPVERFHIAFWLFQFSVLTSLLTIIQIPFQAAIMSYEKMDFYAIVSIFDVLLNLFIALAIPFVSLDKLLIFGLLTLIRAVVIFCMYFLFCKRNFTALKIQDKLDKVLLREMLSFSGWNMFGSFGGMVKDQGLNMILNLFFGPVVNAAKGIATQVAGAVQGFVSNISIAVRPQLTGSYASGDKERAFRMMYTLSKLSFIILYILSLPLIIEVDYVLHLWLGENVPDNASAFIIISILLNYLGSFSSSFSAIIHSSGRMKWYQFTGATCNILVLPVCYIFLLNGCSPVFAYSITICFVILNLIITLFLLNRIEGLAVFDYLKRVILPLIFIVVSTIIIPMIPNYYMNEGFLRLVVVTIVIFLIIPIFFYLFGADKSEKKMIMGMLSNIRKKYI